MSDRPIMKPALSLGEAILRGDVSPSPDLLPHVALRTFASHKCGADGMSTGTATFAPGARLPYHKHAYSEAVVILQGEVLFAVEGRHYRLAAFDCIHVPAGVAHQAVNASDRQPLIVLWSFASADPQRELVTDTFEKIDRLGGQPVLGDPESVVRFTSAPTYELAAATEFRDLFGGQFGTAGICGGYGVFQPGTSLPCHTHVYDESITIVQGVATCQVMGKHYSLSGFRLVA